MSILTVAEKAGRTLGINQKGEREAERTFLVESDTREENATTIRIHDDIPAMFSAHPNDAGLHVVDVAVKQSEEPWFWECTVKYSSVLENGQQDENPLNKPAVISYSTAKFQKIAWKTINNVAITNSAYEWFDPPVMIDDSRPVIRIQKNFATFSQSLAIAYQDAINADVFLGFDPYTVKVDSISADKQFKSMKISDEVYIDLEYWSVTHEFHVNYLTWWMKVMDIGRSVISGGVRRPIVPTNGEAFPQGVPLNGSGQQLALNAAPVFLTYRVYRELPFSALQVP